MGNPNIDTMHRVYEILNSGNLDEADEVISTDLVDHEVPPDIPPTLDGWKTWVGVMRSAFPDMHIAIDDTIADGDKVVVRGTFSGTHEGEFMGMPPTGKSFSVSVIDIGRFAGGKAVEHWGLTDAMAMMEQLGLGPPPT